MHKQFRTFPQLVMVGLLASALAASAQVSPSPANGQASPAKTIDPGSAEKSDRWRCDVTANLRLLLLAGINRREGLCSSSSLASQGG